MSDQKQLLFLGGTCGNNDWRTNFTKELISGGVPADDIFNPVVSDWNAEAQANEEKAKKEATYLMFYIADPKLEDSNLSAYSMVEATMGLYDKPETVVVFDYAGIEGHSRKSMQQTEKVLKARFPTARIFSAAAQAYEWLIGKMAVEDVPNVPPKCKNCGEKFIEHYLSGKSHKCAGFEAG